MCLGRSGVLCVCCIGSELEDEHGRHGTHGVLIDVPVDVEFCGVGVLIDVPVDVEFCGVCICIASGLGGETCDGGGRTRIYTQAIRKVTT